MPEVPECLSRRYQVLDELIKEVSEAAADPGSEEDYPNRLMCDFWKILKEDPECNLTQMIRRRMGLCDVRSSRSFEPHHVTCYMADQQDNKKSFQPRRERNIKTPERSLSGRTCCSKSTSFKPADKNDIPLSKVLGNLKEALSFDKKCNIRIGELLAVEKQLQNQIQHLEHREAEGVQRLKEAECMWSCIQTAYKKKGQESQERRGVILKQMEEVEKNHTKWRKNKKDLEFQCDNMNKCYLEIIEKINEKKNVVKSNQKEIDNLNKRIESIKKDIAASKTSVSKKKTASDAKFANLSGEIAKLQKLINDEKYYKCEKEGEDSEVAQDTRKDLQKICKAVFEKKLETEDLIAKKDALEQEIEILNQTYDQCQETCQNKQKSVTDEIAKIDEEIANFKVRCIRCHQSSDTEDARMFCTDCSRCATERDCKYEDGHCVHDATQDCVCMAIKQKFLDNVFDNMYTILENHAKTPPGKAVAQAVLECLKKSRNGKLNGETRKILQDFVLTTVRKNLTLTIVGGAVKTRCEMDPETYKQLILCLKDIKAVKIPKADKGTDSKKESCRRWGGTNECNCPKGPHACICIKKAPIPPNEPEPCPPDVDKEDTGEIKMCPHRDSVACGVDCAMHANSVGAEVAAWRPAPCNDNQCKFSKNMRSAQCTLGPHSMSSSSKPKEHVVTTIYSPNLMEPDQNLCDCELALIKSCACRNRDIKTYKDCRKVTTSKNHARIWEKVYKSAVNRRNNKIKKNIDVQSATISKQKQLRPEVRASRGNNYLDENHLTLSHSNRSPEENVYEDMSNIASNYLEEKKFKHLDLRLDNILKTEVVKTKEKNSRNKALEKSDLIDLNMKSTDQNKIPVWDPKHQSDTEENKINCNHDNINKNNCNENSLNDLGPAYKNIENAVLNSPKYLFKTKFSSDSNLLDKVRMRLQNHHSYLSEPFNLLRKTNSGKYALVLSKQSKKTFIRDLKSYVASFQGLNSVTRTRSGEIKFVLNSEDEMMGQYGPLKITTSGNMYISVNEEKIKNMLKNEVKLLSDDLPAPLEIKLIKHVSNKSITTSKPNQSSRCISDNFLNYAYPENARDSNVSDEQRKMKTDYKYHKPEKKIDKYDVSRLNVDKTHNLVTRMSKYRVVQSDSKDVIQSLFYVNAAVYPFSKDDICPAPNDSLKSRSVLKNETRINADVNNLDTTNSAVTMQHELSNLEYLDFLPLQLPVFLQNF